VQIKSHLQNACKIVEKGAPARMSAGTEIHRLSVKFDGLCQIARVPVQV
jgi:hypothetical protein